MTCLSASAIAEAATTGAADDHVAQCLACRRQVDTERALRERLQRLPAFTLPTARRRELAAELVAMAEREPTSRAWRVPVTVVVALAAAVALVAAWPRSRVAVAFDVPAGEHVVVPERAIAHELAPPRLRAPRIEARDGARLSQRIGDDRDIVTLTDGDIEIDSRAARNVDVKIGSAVVRVDDAKVVVRARHRAIVNVEVVIGAAAVIGTDRRVIVERGSVWSSEPTASERSLRAFRDAWVALRSGHNAEAMELFDAATDRAVAEEAAYWGAIAAKRAGQDDAARDRLTDFVQRFPQSPYVAQAKALLAAH
jgi:hypothetical protein